MQASATLVKVLDYINQFGSIHDLEKRFIIAYAKHPLSDYIWVEVFTKDGKWRVVHDNWDDFSRYWQIDEELDSTINPEGF